jgi:translation initiation factor 1
MVPGDSRRDTLVYSSGPAARPPRDARPPTAPPVSKTEVVRIWLEKKGRNGKPVCIVRDLALNDDALAALAARLKRACGTGGTAKDGEIIIQGDHRDAIATLLTRDGFRVKKAGG